MNNTKENNFIPKKFFSSGFSQTILAFFLKSKSNIKYNKIILPLKDNSKIVLYTHIKDKSKPTAIIVHGLTGSSNSVYVERMSSKLISYGFNVIKFNLRSADGTENLTTKIYNAAQSYDLKEAIIYLKKIKLKNFFILGFSLGGNVCLKFAEENPQLKSQIKAVAVLSPLIDLKESSSFIEKSKFFSYIFLKKLKNLIKIKAKYFPKLYNLSNINKVKTIRDFDELYQAPISGYKNADDYYEKASVIKKLNNIKIPTLIIHSKDDPIVPYSSLTKAKIKNKYIKLITTNRGGHVGFIANTTKQEDKFWAENRILEFFNSIKKTLIIQNQNI